MVVQELVDEIAVGAVDLHSVEASGDGVGRAVGKGLHESLDIVERTLPDDSIQRALAQSLLGEALVGQGRFAEAEPLLRAGCGTMAKNPEAPDLNKREGVERLVKLYEAWGRPEQAAEFKAALAAETTTLDEVLPKAFAMVREASRRTLGLRHFDVQIVGGVVMHEGKMKVPKGDTTIEPDDRVVVFARPGAIPLVEKLFN